MFQKIATVVIGFIVACLMWVVTIAIVKWTISQEFYIHLLGIITLGGGAIVVSSMLTIRIFKRVKNSLFPGRAL